MLNLAQLLTFLAVTGIANGVGWRELWAVQLRAMQGATHNHNKCDW
jgi:hypothetical protein